MDVHDFHRAGGSLEPNRSNGKKFVPAPPLCLLIDQQLIETTQRTSDGDKTQKIYTEQELFGTCCTVDDAALTLYGVKVNTRLDTPSSGTKFLLQMLNVTKMRLKTHLFVHSTKSNIVGIETTSVRSAIGAHGNSFSSHQASTYGSPDQWRHPCA